MDLTIIIPFHDAENFLFRCLDSLKSDISDECDVEIILIDDNSSDASVEIAHDFQEKNNNLDIIIYQFCKRRSWEIEKFGY